MDGCESCSIPEVMTIHDLIRVDDMSDSVMMLLLDAIREFQPTHLVLFQCQQMDSSCFGSSTIIPIGPNNTYKTMEDVKGKWLHDLPSQRQYPVAFYHVECPRNKLYLLYCKSQGFDNQPDAMVEHDRKEYPGGEMTGFILWSNKKRKQFDKDEYLDVTPSYTRTEAQDKKFIETWLPEHLEQ